MNTIWTAAQASEATNGINEKDWNATGISIDTRSLQPGDLFVALKDARDGHDFVAEAFEKGAAAALVTHRPDAVAPDAPLLIVPDVLAALEALGRAARARCQGRVLAITGSVGKTTTKEMIRTALKGQGHVHAAEASYNNHWGVPLTLARMPAETDFAIVEIGMNHPGEIAPLAKITRPDVALITAIAPAHLEAFASLDDIAREKASIFEGLQPSGTAIFCADVDTAPILAAKAAKHSENSVSFGAKATARYQLEQTHITQSASSARARANGESFLIKLASPGEHLLMNALAVAAAVDALGADRDRALIALGDWKAVGGRGSRVRVQFDTGAHTAYFDLIDDAFNANPTSVAAALDVLIHTQPESTGRRIAILGDMLELGQSENACHAAIAVHPNIEKIDVIHCVGPRMAALFDALGPSQTASHHDSAAELARDIHKRVAPGDVILVKGSKRSHVSLVVDALRKLGHAPAQA